MAAKVLDMNGGALEPPAEQAERPVRASFYAENRTAPYLLARKDEHGKRVYFIRVGMTGLHRRVLGPYRKKSRAIKAFDGLLVALLDAFDNAANENATPGQGNDSHIMIEPPEDLLPVCRSPI